MDLREILRSPKLAIVVGVFVVLIVSVNAYAYLGWLGIGFTGIMGLLISVRLDLHDGHAVADINHGIPAASMYAKQIEEERSHSKPEERVATKEKKSKRSLLLFYINIFFVGLAAIGFGLFYLYQI